MGSADDGECNGDVNDIEAYFDWLGARAAAAPRPQIRRCVVAEVGGKLHEKAFFDRMGTGAAAAQRPQIR